MKLPRHRVYTNPQELREREDLERAIETLGTRITTVEAKPEPVIPEPVNIATVTLPQYQTHQAPDTDSGMGAIHHTLGTSAYQAAPGNHNHDAAYAALLHATRHASGGADPVTPTAIGAEPANANIQTHITRTDNPHGVTAAQANALPITGGTINAIGSYLGGVKIDGDQAPCHQLLWNGTVKAYLGIATGAGYFCTDSAAGDTVLRAGQILYLAAGDSPSASVSSTGTTFTRTVTVKNTYLNIADSGGTIVGSLNASGECKFSTLYLARPSSTGAYRTIFDAASAWVDNTDASRKGRARFHVYDTTNREYLRAESDGTQPLISFYGVSAVARQPVTYTANAQSSAYTSTPSALNQAATLADLNTLRTAYENLRTAYETLRTALVNTGIIKTS